MREEKKNLKWERKVSEENNLKWERKLKEEKEFEVRKEIEGGKEGLIEIKRNKKEGKENV